MLKTKTILWLDDLRQVPMDTSDEHYEWVKDFYEFQMWILENGVPDVLDLDHDLGGQYSGYDCLKFCIGIVVGNHLDIPELRVHSMNPVGRDNMVKYYENFVKMYSKDQR
jgi:hypothetical protein